MTGRRPTLTRALLLALITALAVLPGSALGGAPERVQERVVDVFENVDVCGVNVDIVSEVRFTELTFFDKEGNFLRFMSPASGRTTFTTDDGRQVVQHFAQLFIQEEIVDEQAGTLTLLFTFKGLPSQLKSAQGGVVLRDAGIITFALTLDLETGEELSFETILIKGPHPEAESDFTIFCDAFLEALG
jgi:hypothetical protein